MECQFYTVPWRNTYEVIQEPGDEVVGSKTCFPCSVCNECLAGREFHERSGAKYCWKCFEKAFGLKCAYCGQSIKGMSQLTFIFYNNLILHKECFNCFNCGTPLSTDGFSQNKNAIKCSRCGAQNFRVR